MAATTLLSDNGVTSGITGYTLTGGNDGTLQLQTTTAGGTATTAITIDASQNVGVGTSSPSKQLEVSKTGKFGLGNTIGTAAIQFTHSDASALVWQLNSGISGVTHTAMSIGTVASPSMLNIDSSGNVGIGTSSPTKKLEVGSLGAFRLQTGSVTMDCTPTAGGTDGFVWNVSAGYYSWNIGGTQRVLLDANGYFKASNTGAYEGGAYNEINASGEYGLVVVGRAASSRTAVGYFRATTSNAYGNLLQGVNGATTTFQVLASGNVQNTNNSYGAISDVKVKENITDATPKLNGLMQVRIVNYNLIGDTNKQLGVVAQELEQIFPGMVEESPDYENVTTTDDDGNELTDRVLTGTTTKSVKYSVFVPMLIKAMQEQQALITTLTERITALENK